MIVWFFDWIKVYQDFDFELPIVSSRAYANINVENGDILSLSQPMFSHEGSYSSSINIRISGNRITIDGNPSKFNRLDNLFGLKTLDECMAVYNDILVSLGLPVFTKCTRVWQFTDKQNGSPKMVTATDGAVFQRIDVTSNLTTSGCAKDYIKGISTLPYRNSNPHLYPNGATCDWRTSKGGVSSLLYAKIYDKAHELLLHTLPKIKRKFGPDSLEYFYVKKLYNYCLDLGVVRFEQELKSEILRRLNARYWGQFTEIKFDKIVNDFIDLDKKLQVTSMDFENISELLLRENIVSNLKAANTTCMYAIQWMHGKSFDKNLTQVKMHRARLRKIGIDICRPCNISMMSPVYVKSAKEVLTDSLACPDWYRAA